jgi:hypothetical protein
MWSIAKHISIFTIPINIDMRSTSDPLINNGIRHVGWYFYDIAGLHRVRADEQLLWRSFVVGEIVVVTYNVCREPNARVDHKISGWSAATIFPSRLNVKIDYLQRMDIGIDNCVFRKIPLPISSNIDVETININERAFDSDQSLIRGASQALGFKPEEDGRQAKNEGEERDPFIWFKPQYAAVGGLVFGNCLNLFGGWLYLYDDRRPCWTRRRLAGVIVIVAGIATMISGYLWAAMSGGGY